MKHETATKSEFLLPDERKDRPLGHKARQAEASRSRICGAAVQAIDRHGYAGASIQIIQAEAGVSRGALTHHFPTKQALVAETARRLLARAMPAPRRNKRAASVEAMILDAWRRIVNTSEGRAFVEILIAARTDADLHAELSPFLRDWDRQVGEAAAKVFAPVSGDEGDVEVLWAICRTFLRGLIVHERFTGNRKVLEPHVHRFAAMLAGHLTLRDEEQAP